MTTLRLRETLLRVVLALGLFAAADSSAAEAGSAHSFSFLAPPFTQELYAVNPASFLGGVAFSADGDLLVDGCAGDSGGLFRYAAGRLAPATFGTTTLHPVTALQANTGCGLASHPNGSVYTNTVDGALRLSESTGAVLAGPFGLPGSALGMAVDPVTQNLVYVGGDGALVYVNPAFTAGGTLSTATQGDGIDQITFSPDGQYVFGSADENNQVDVVRRDGTLVRRVSLQFGSFPDGIAFHATNPQFVLTNNNDGSMTRFDFPGNDFSKVPSQSQFASGGARGDMLQTGPDTCVYLTQDGTTYDDGTRTGDNSVVRICPGFSTPVSSCPKTLFVGMIGSGQKYINETDLSVSPQLNNVYRGMLSTMGPGASIRAAIVDYPALGVETLTRGLADVSGSKLDPGTYGKYLRLLRQNLDTYLTGKDKGLARLRTLFVKERKNCAQTKIVLAGYSQGAMIVHEFANELASSADAAAIKAVAGVVVLADPERVIHSQVTEFGDASNTGYGVCPLIAALASCTSPAALSDVAAPLRPAARGVCIKLDPVCDTRELLSQLVVNTAEGRKELVKLAAKIHSSYSYWPAVNTVGRGLGLKLRLGSPIHGR